MSCHIPFVPLNSVLLNSQSNVSCQRTSPEKKTWRCTRQTRPPLYWCSLPMPWRTNMHVFPVNWFHSLFICLQEISPCVRTCWLRTAAGGWTTSIRMHSDVLLCRCMFGCIDSEDVLTHYLCCPILWCLAREISGISETDVSIISRLSIQYPSKDKLVLLAYCHVLYHCAINDRECIKLHCDGNPFIRSDLHHLLGLAEMVLTIDSWFDS